MDTSDTLLTSVATARRAQRLAFALIACIAFTSGTLLVAGAWTIGTSVGVLVAGSVLAWFIRSLVLAVEQRNAHSRR
jgi:hypothetical protein